MLTNTIDIWGIVFELTIFYLLVVSVYKITKDHVLPFLYIEIDNIKKQKKDLKEKEELLSQSAIKVEENIKEQKETFSLLEKKVDLWKQSISEQKKTKEEKVAKTLKKVKEKRKKQEANLSLINLQKIVVPSSIQLAYDKIQDKYGGDKSLGLLNELISVIQPAKNNT